VHVEGGGSVGHRLVLGDRDELGPAAVVDGGVGVQQPSVDLVAGGVAGDGRADLLDDAGVVAAQDDRELIGEHGLEVAGGDAGVDWVDRGGLDPDQQLPGADLGAG
jgi:hypothetical protein